MNHSSQAIRLSQPLWLPVLLCCLVLSLDWVTPLGVATGIAYIPLVFCSLWFTYPRTAFVFAAIGTVLIIVGYFISPPNPSNFSIVLINRGLSVGVLWFMAVLIYMFRQRALKLQNSEGKLRAVLDYILDGIITIDERGSIESFNLSCERIFGFKADEVIGQNIKILMPEPYHGEHDGYLSRYIATGNARIIGTAGREVRGRRKDGSIFPMDLSVSAFQLNGQRHFSGIIRDISERKQAEKAQGFLAAIVESSADAIVGKDLNGIIHSWNASAERLFGYSAAEAIGRHIYFIIPPELQKEEEHIIAEVAAGRSVEHYETRRLHKDGSLVDISLTVSPMCDANGKVIGASKIARDISERREADKAREQLRQAQKMESLGQLTGGIAHDFNNILAVLVGNLDLMQARIKEDDPLRRFIDPGIEAALHGAELTRRLLAFSRKQTLQPKNTSVNELISTFSTWVKRVLGERIEIIMSLAPDLWTVHIDPGQLQDALLNLSVNARDAMPDGGKLIYETRNVVLDADYAAQNIDVVPGDYAMLAVSDTGQGMTAEVIEKAFEPFFTTKEVGKGSGLGLSMVYGFVRQSAGHIKIYSEPGHGVSIKIYLPRTEGVPSPIKKPADNVLSSEKHDKIVLVVEDNEKVLMVTAEFVAEMGYKVITAETGDAALEIVRTRPDIALLLTDVMLPGKVNGPVLAQQASKIVPGLKVLFVSGYAEHAIVQSGLLEEGAHLISKPFRKQQLAEKIAELFNSDRS